MLSPDGSTTPIILNVYDNFGNWGGWKFTYKQSNMFLRGIKVSHHKTSFSSEDKMGVTGLATEFCKF
jgi:hypothetical protein